MEQEKVVVEKYITVLKELQILRALKSKHDFTSQIGEWFVETIYDGKTEESSIQKGWDIDVNGYHIQVKTHAKAESNNKRWSVVNRSAIEKIDEHIIIEFTQYYKLLKFYKVLWVEALNVLKSKNGMPTSFGLSRNNIESFKVNLDALLKHSVVSFFR